MIDVRRAAERSVTSLPGVITRHSFSFGRHNDPGNVAFSALVAHNDDLLQPGAGYETHPHADTEIVTWVLSGALLHEDSTGERAVVTPGQVQRLRAGTGVRHSEHADPGRGPTRFVQMWLRPDELGVQPSYAVADVATSTGLVAVASGIPVVRAAVAVDVCGAALHVARLAAAETVELPSAPHLHVFAVRGSADIGPAAVLEEGDAVRLTDEPAPVLTARTPAEVLVWQLP